MNLENISLYYSEYFPLYGIVDKLELAGPLHLREISFCLENGSYARNLSFKDHKQLHEKIKTLKPIKIDIGAIYRTKTGLKELFSFSKRELVFDIDASDYDEIRTCCKEKCFCEKCYRIVLLSCMLLNYIMKSIES